MNNDTKKRILVAGAGGFIGGHFVKRMKAKGHYVRAVDVKPHDFEDMSLIADEWILGDLTDFNVVNKCLDRKDIDEVYDFCERMGGSEYIFVGNNDADIMRDSSLMHTNILDGMVKYKIPKVFFSSSACVYNQLNQKDPNNPNCSEDSAFPAYPDSCYGYAKLFTELLYDAYHRNYGIDIRIGRFHNIFGPNGTWCGGKEKAPAAICRKIALCNDGGEIEIFGDGEQTRSFLYVDECLEAVERLMESNFTKPINIGSDEMVTINKLVELVSEISGKKINVKHNTNVNHTGVRGRNSDNNLIFKTLGWKPSGKLVDGLKVTYNWIVQQVNNN